MEGLNRRLSVGFICDECKCSRPLRSPLCHPCDAYFAVGTAYDHVDREGDTTHVFEVPGIRPRKGYNPSHFEDDGAESTKKGRDPMEELNRQLDGDVEPVQKVAQWCIDIIPKKYPPWNDEGRLFFHKSLADPMWHKDKKARVLDGEFPSYKEMENNWHELYFKGVTRSKLFLPEGNPNVAKTITLMVNMRMDANVRVDTMRRAVCHLGSSTPVHLHPWQWGEASPRCCVCVAPTRSSSEDHARQTLMMGGQASACLWAGGGGSDATSLPGPKCTACGKRQSTVFGRHYSSHRVEFMVQGRNENHL